MIDFFYPLKVLSNRLKCLPGFVIRSIQMLYVGKPSVNVSDSRARSLVQSSTTKIYLEAHLKLIAAIDIQTRVGLQLPKVFRADGKGGAVHDRRFEQIASVELVVAVMQGNPLCVEVPIENRSALSQRSDLVSLFVDDVERWNDNCAVVFDDWLQERRQEIVTSFDVTIEEQQNITGRVTSASQSTPNQSRTLVHREQLDSTVPTLHFDVRFQLFVQRSFSGRVVNQNYFFHKFQRRTIHKAVNRPEQSREVLVIEWNDDRNRRQRTFVKFRFAPGIKFR